MKVVFYENFKSNIKLLKQNQTEYTPFFKTKPFVVSENNKKVFRTSVDWVYNVYHLECEKNKKLLIKLNKNLLMTTNYGESLTKGYSTFWETYLKEVNNTLDYEAARNLTNSYVSLILIESEENTFHMLFNPILEVCDYIFDKSLKELHPKWYQFNNGLKYIIQNKTVGINIASPNKIYQQKVELGNLTFKYSDFIANFIQHLDSYWMHLSLSKLNKFNIHPYATIHDSMCITQTSETNLSTSLILSSKEFIREHLCITNWLNNKIGVYNTIEHFYIKKGKFYICKDGLHMTLGSNFLKCTDFSFLHLYKEKFLDKHFIKIHKKGEEDCYCEDINWFLIRDNLKKELNPFYIMNVLILLMLLNSTKLLDYLGLNDELFISKRVKSIKAMGKKVPFNYLLEVLFKDLAKLSFKKKIRGKQIIEYSDHMSYFTYLFLLITFNKLSFKKINYIRVSLIYIIELIIKHVVCLKNKEFKWKKYKKTSKKSKIDILRLWNASKSTNHNYSEEFIECVKVLITSMVIKPNFDFDDIRLSVYNNSFCIFNIKGLYKVDNYLLKTFLDYNKLQDCFKKD